MDGKQLCDTFQLNDDDIFNQQVEPVADIHSKTVELHRQDVFCFNPYTTSFKVVTQAGSVGTFQQARSQG